MEPADLAADPRLERLWLHARERIEASGGREATGSFTISAPTEEERIAVGLLLGRHFRGGGLRISLERLDRSLRESAPGEGLISVLERRGGPLRDRPSERSRAEAAKERCWEEARGHPALGRHPGLAGWLPHLRRTGSLRGKPRQRAALLGDVLDALSELPARGLARSVLAADLFGDAHALDDARPAGRLTLAALAWLAGEPAPARADDRRRLWERWGVVPEGAASRVLVLGLRPAGDAPVARALRALADAGLPVPVTLPMLLAEEIALENAGVAFACENPTILEVAARRFGPASPLMISTEGMPSVAARKLFDVLTGAGTRLLYHGDFGAGGLRIGNVVIGECGADPWRFGAADYRSALDAVRDTTPIRAPVPDAGWDPALAPLLRAECREVHEEQLIETLLADLVMGGSGSPAGERGRSARPRSG